MISRERAQQTADHHIYPLIGGFGIVGYMVERDIHDGWGITVLLSQQDAGAFSIIPEMLDGVKVGFMITVKATAGPARAKGEQDADRAREAGQAGVGEQEAGRVG